MIKLLQIINEIRAIEYHKGNYEINIEELRRKKVCVFCGHKLSGRKRKYCSDRCSYFWSHCYCEVYVWVNIRRRILRRDKYICQKCREKARQVHHIKSRFEGGSDDESNLISLCKDCHKKETAKLMKKVGEEIRLANEKMKKYRKEKELEDFYKKQKQITEFLGINNKKL